ncbi:MAG: helix-turn-helix transcriptional regulator [Magnetococcales bacterium]|nr:helix-turn-helix transcriptional regulator [Magnetococcales bacterium]
MIEGKIEQLAVSDVVSYVVHQVAHTENLSVRLKKYRVENKMSQSAFATLIGVSRHVVSDIEGFIHLPARLFLLSLQSQYRRWHHQRR